ncbi:hypothetical protein ACA910_007464 [Epithemia clementina (nom. ined.)]
MSAVQIVMDNNARALSNQYDCSTTTTESLESPPSTNRPSIPSTSRPDATTTAMSNRSLSSSNSSQSRSRRPQGGRIPTVWTDELRLLSNYNNSHVGEMDVDSFNYYCDDVSSSQYESSCGGGSCSRGNHPPNHQHCRSRQDQDDHHYHGDSHEKNKKNKKKTNESGLFLLGTTTQATRTVTRRVTVWRSLVLAMLLAAGATTSALSYWVLKDEQTQDFKVSFHLLIENLQDVRVHRIFQVQSALASLRESMSATADTLAQTAAANQTNNNNETTTITSNSSTSSSSSLFPFVTIPNFEFTAGFVRQVTGLELVLYCPLVVTEDDREAWNNYSVTHATDWMSASQAWLSLQQQGQQQEEARASGFVPATTSSTETANITPFVYVPSTDDDDTGENRIQPATTSPYLPIWQTSPPPNSPRLINYNVMEDALMQRYFSILQTMSVTEKNDGVLLLTEDVNASQFLLGQEWAISNADHWAFHQRVHNQSANHDNNNNNANSSSSFQMEQSQYGYAYPHSWLLSPVYQELGGLVQQGGNTNTTNATSSSTDSSTTTTKQPKTLVGVVLALLPWDAFLQNVQPEGAGMIYAVQMNSCNQVHTYLVNGTKTEYLGPGDLHDPKFDHMELAFDLFDDDYYSPGVRDQMCLYGFHFYPTQELSDEYRTPLPEIMAGAVAATFFVMAVAFFIYDRFVRMRNNKVIDAALRSGRIVSSLFPETVRDRLLAEQEMAERREQQQQQQHIYAGIQTRLKKFLADDKPLISVLDETETETDEDKYGTSPIADLFPEASVLFADIAGFTAWSSAREPSQVFILLETVFRAFDEIATRRRVFKVETVGDCYVAATGLPEPRQDHAVALARFAKDCMAKMHTLVRKLEVTLGPDTADLAMRMGMHSGPVTAGVLRGERSRFQLFGDTMNTASRMESTGIREKIQISQETADLLIAAGKKSWIRPREDIVAPKGKGEMRTYWLEVRPPKGTTDRKTSLQTHSTEEVRSGDNTSRSGDGTLSSDDGTDGEDEEAISQPPASAKILRLIDWNVDVLMRQLKRIVARRKAYGLDHHDDTSTMVEDFSRSDGRTVLEEVVERIELPEFEPSIAQMQLPSEDITLDPEAEAQLYDYVATIAAMYRDNPFHNFEHASHVTMSVSKLLSRIVAPTDLDFQNSVATNQHLHDHTYGITSDPLTQFACVLSALIHDVDHTGVPNSQLVKENAGIASYYKGRSVAEQNSVDVAWDLLFDNCYLKLRQTIYRNNEELQRFRKLVVNSVMATDIMDKDLIQQRNARWDLAFSEKSATDDPLITVQRKATIVIEHLIQASDVAHTMQHWHVYRKWNGRLFEELYKAYKKGRSEKNPADFWYKGEIGFLKHYIIPLAKKLKNCGVFGVSSDEYLNYAEHNLKEWEARGQEVVGELVEHVKEIYDVHVAPPDPVASVNAENTSTPPGDSSLNRALVQL